MQDLDIGLLTAKSLVSKDEGRAFLNILTDSAPRLAPEKFGNYEPLKDRFEKDNTEPALMYWKWPFLWNRRSPKTLGRVWMGDHRVHTSIYISTQYESRNVDETLSFFLKCAAFIEPDFAYMHLFTSSEQARYPYEMIMPFRQGVTTHELRNYLPNIAWATILGPPYVELFGREK